jgi:LAO/AO transport system kinase
MQEHHADPGVFIRSMATRGVLGGLAAATLDLVLLFDAAGFDAVIIETVGVGQDEIEVARVAGVTVVVLVPGLGDDVQALKAGLLEVADVFVINKSDHPGAARLERDLKAMLNLGAPRSGWTPPIVRTIASEGHGVAEALDAIERFFASGAAHHDAALEWEFRLREMFQLRAVDRLDPLAVAEAAARVARREIDPYTTVQDWLTRFPTPQFPIDHLGIAVASIDAALAFYQGVLGMTLEGRETVAAESVHVAMLAAGSSRLELLEPSAPFSPIAKFLDKRGPGLHHVALRVPALAAAVEKLKASGARLLNEPRPGAGGHLYVFVHPASTGGVLLELVEASSPDGETGFSLSPG